VFSAVSAKKERKFIDYSEFRIKIFRFNLVITEIQHNLLNNGHRYRAGEKRDYKQIPQASSES
jgi:hypothetical protein